MPPRKILSLNIALIILALVVGRAISQEKKEPAAQPPMPDMAEMMKKWQATITPGEEHKFLESFVGKWNTTTKMWMAGPDGPPTESKGVAEFRSVLGGRFVQQEIIGEMIMPDATGAMKPVKYNGLGMTGYDKFRHMYVGCWSDTTTTALLNFSGMTDPARKTLTMYGQMDEAMLDVVARTVKYVTTIESDKKFTFAVYDLHADADYKALEITYEKQ